MVLELPKVWTQLGRDMIRSGEPSDKMKELILNADDFGLTRGVNQGIIRAHRDGILTSATLMATGPAFEDAVSLARANPQLGVGCHLVLTGGAPVAPYREIRSLVGKGRGLPKSLGLLLARISLGRVRPEDLERELRAQIEKIREAGIEPTHIDTHKHTHAHPVIMGALGRVAREFGITRVRKPTENLRHSWASVRNGGRILSRQLAAAATAKVVARRFQAIAGQYGLKYPENFLGLAMTGRLGPEGLRCLIDMLPEGRTEIMVHPGVCDSELTSTGTRLRKQRQVELRGVTDPGVKRAVLEQGIRLISFRELN